jgi:hypothetical protein
MDAFAGVQGYAQVSAKSGAIDNQFIGGQEGVICLHWKRSGRCGIIQTESAGGPGSFPRASPCGNQYSRKETIALRQADPSGIG